VGFFAGFVSDAGWTLPTPQRNLNRIRWRVVANRKKWKELFCHHLFAYDMAVNRPR
jgi:hypothetical protein